MVCCQRSAQHVCSCVHTWAASWEMYSVLYSVQQGFHEDGGVTDILGTQRSGSITSMEPTVDQILSSSQRSLRWAQFDELFFRQLCFLALSFAVPVLSMLRSWLQKTCLYSGGRAQKEISLYQALRWIPLAHPWPELL